MYRNYLTEYRVPTPSELADRVRDNLGAVSDLTDGEVMYLCEDAVFDDSICSALPVRECGKLIKRVFSCLRCELELLSEIADDPEVSEIMVNGCSDIFYEKNGKVFRADFVLDSAEQLRRIIQRLSAKVGREMNDLNPIVDARLSDGSRINAVNDNIAIGGPILTIRKFNRSRMTMENLVDQGDISSEAAEFCIELVRSGYNVFISGGTSSGKTTFLNILSDYIPENERIVVIEDSAELQIRGHENLVRMEAKSANSQGKGEVSIKDLIKTSLRMRPDRIIVGEVRGEEVTDMLAAMSTGHDGSLSTGHANSPAGMVGRLETLHIASSGFPLEAVRAQIAEAIEIVIQLKRFPDGHRRVTEIWEIEGVSDGQIVFNKLFTWNNGKMEIERTENGLKRDEKYKTCSGRLTGGAGGFL